MVVCLERGADLHMAQLMPLLLTVSCSSKIQIGFTCLVPAYPRCLEKRPLNGSSSSSSSDMLSVDGHAGSAVKVSVAIQYSVVVARNGYIRNVGLVV